MNTTIRTNRAALPLLLALALGCFGSVANAADAPPATAIPKDAPRVTVDFADLDLSRPAGAEALYQRLRAAASRVCGDPDARRLEERVQRGVCREQAIERAVAGIGSRSFSAWYAARKSGTTPGELVAGTK